MDTHPKLAETILSRLRVGRDGNTGSGFAGVIAMAGSKPKLLGRDVPALFEAYSLLETAIMACGVTTNGESQHTSLPHDEQILQSDALSCVLYKEPRSFLEPGRSPTPSIALLKRINAGMMEYQAQWTSELARSLPLMQGSSRRLGFDLKHCSGVLGLFYTEEHQGDLCYIMPDWYGVFWLDGFIEQCTAFPMLRSVFTQLPDNIDWVDAIAARIKDSGLVPVSKSWSVV